jgi:hypothetical protein
MNDQKINHLIELSTEAGYNNKIVLYRCHLLGSFLSETLLDYPEFNKEKVFKSFIDFTNLLHVVKLPFTTALAHLYLFGKLKKNSVEIFEKYPQIVDKISEFLLGNIPWLPSEQEHEDALKKAELSLITQLNTLYTDEAGERVSPNIDFCD